MTDYITPKLVLLADYLRIKARLVPGLYPLCETLLKAGNIIYDFLQGVITAQKAPIYIVGLPRSGTTWVASIINTAHSIKYFHEPFNCKNVPGASKFCMKYLYSDADQEFVRRSHDAFSGRMSEVSVREMLSPTYKKRPWWPGRVVIKDVCSCLAVETVYRSVAPVTMIVIRHPCAVAASWYKLQYDIDHHLEIMLNQTQLCSGILNPYQSTLRTAQGFWQKMGALWGAVYYVLFHQQKAHPDWLIVKHEDFCLNPVEKFQNLFQKLDLKWTRTTNALVQVSTQIESIEPYLVHRVSAQEPDKWKKLLNNKQIEQVINFVKPFKISLYPDC